MPRPKIFLLITDAGGGHRGSAEALAAWAKLQGKDWDLRIVNMYKEVWREAEPLGNLTGVYGEDIYNFTLKHSLLSTASVLRVAARFAAKLPNAKALRDGVAWLRAERPDLCISLMPFVNDTLAQICAEAGVPFGLVMTDLVDQRPYMWYTPLACRSAVLVAAPCPQAAAQAREAGAREPLECGLLLHPKWMDPALRARDPRELRLELGLDPGAFTVLLSMGGVGGTALEQLVTDLDKVGQGWQLVVACGKNEALRLRLERRPMGRHRLTALGFTLDLPRWMRAADLMLGKPGPASLFEAIALGTPLILDAQAAMPQEAPNAALAQEAGLALRVARRKDLSGVVAQAWSQPQLLRAMHEAQGRYPLAQTGIALLDAIERVMAKERVAA